MEGKRHRDPRENSNAPARPKLHQHHYEQPFNNQNANAIANALSQTSNNSNSVNSLGQSADGSYNQSQMQDVPNKLDELINALRR